MDPLTLAGISFAAGLFGILLGAFARRLLPNDEPSPDSKDVLKLSLGIVVSLTALVLGLLVASAKSGYDMRRSEINRMTASVVLLDHLLFEYGDGAMATRIALRKEVPLLVKRIWSETPSPMIQPGPFRSLPEGEALYQLLLNLEATTLAQRELRSRVLQLVRDLSELRLLLFSHFSSSVPLPFLAIVMLWIVVLFTGFSLMAPPSPIAVTSLLVCAISVAGAIFLILELDQPFTGIMTIPSDALERALPPL